MGTAYGAADTWMICRKAASGFQDDAPQGTYALINVTSSGVLLVGNTSVDSSSNGWKVVPNNGGRTGYTNTLASASETTNTYSCHDMYSTGAGAYRFYVGWGGTIYATNTTVSAISDIQIGRAHV